MADFPTPFSGAAALYPTTIARRMPVAVLKYTDATEQRYRQSAGVDRVTLELTGISKDAKDDIVDFFETCKGSFDATWSITLGDSVYPYMAFASDELKATETESGMWSMSIPLTQTRKG